MHSAHVRCCSLTIAALKTNVFKKKNEFNFFNLFCLSTHSLLIFFSSPVIPHLATAQHFYSLSSFLFFFFQSPHSSPASLLLHSSSFFFFPSLKSNKSLLTTHAFPNFFFYSISRRSPTMAPILTSPPKKNCYKNQPNRLVSQSLQANIIEKSVSIIGTD